MEFTYTAYKNLLELLKKEKYMITNYHDYDLCPENSDIVILRHDIDYSLEKALEMAELESDMGAQSTYFVLMTGEFYNPAAGRSIEILKRIHAMGHEIGLHFDEACYKEQGINEILAIAEKERKILESLIEEPISSVSMHRPSKMVLENDIQFENMVNSYSNVFFKEFKYVSDSRMHWREDVEKIIKSHNYHRLHILIHAFWYAELANEGTGDKIIKFISKAAEERYCSFKENFRDLDEFVKREDVV